MRSIHDVVGEEAPSDVDHFFWRVPRDQRPQFAADIVEEYERAIFFTRTKHGADRLARQLEERGISAVPLHGDRTQAQRERALRSVKNGQIHVLVATDVAARGIHIDLMPVVVHYDPPAQATDYLHRSGRTGRAGATGAVISLVGEDVIGQVKRLQKALGISPRSNHQVTPRPFASVQSTTPSPLNVSTTEAAGAVPSDRSNASAVLDPLSVANRVNPAHRTDPLEASATAHRVPSVPHALSAVSVIVWSATAILDPRGPRDRIRPRSDSVLPLSVPRASSAISTRVSVVPRLRAGRVARPS